MKKNGLVQWQIIPEKVSIGLLISLKIIGVLNVDNIHISVIKRKNGRSGTNEPTDSRNRKFSARGQQQETKSSERLKGKVEFSTVAKNSPFNKVYQNNTSGNSKRKRAKSKKHHTGSEILLNENSMSLQQDKNYSIDVGKNKSIIELYKPPQGKAGHLKKKSLQYAMKRSRINDLIKNNLSIEGGGLVNERNLKLAISKERKKTTEYGKRFRDFRHSSSSLPHAVGLNPQLNQNTRNRNYNLYPYESQQMSGMENRKNRSSMQFKNRKFSLRYGQKKSHNTIYKNNIIVNANFVPASKLPKNHSKPSAKLLHSVDGEGWHFERQKFSYDNINLENKNK